MPARPAAGLYTLYEPRAIEGNHEKFVRGEIVASRRVRSLAVGD